MTRRKLQAPECSQTCEATPNSPHFEISNNNSNNMSGPAAHKSLINLLRGWPNPALLPVSQIKAASVTALSDPDVSEPGLLYGPDWGFEPLREQIAAWLTKFYQPQNSIGVERICITGGASQNIACMLQGFSDPNYTRNVWIVSPAYFMACRIFEDSGFYGRLRSVPEDDEGIDIEFLRKEVCKSDEEKGNYSPQIKPSRSFSKTYRHLVYAVPTFANPSSTTMSLARRQELVTVAREHDALIITDDVYDQLQWPAAVDAKQSSLETAVLPRVVDVDRYYQGGAQREGSDGFGNAVSNGSFSKIAGPGCRTGWAEGTEKFSYGLSQVGSSKSGGAPSQLVATFMSDLLSTSALQEHVFHTLQPAYARRYRSMISAIERYLVPLGVTLPQTNRDVVGGYFVWLKLPKPLIADEVAVKAKEAENLIIAQGSLFAVYGDRMKGKGNLEREIRLCFSWEEEERLADGIERLGKVVQEMLEDGGMDTRGRMEEGTGGYH